ncbi:hypothetical protein [Rheinheimera tangshanensis]|uniref:GP-PDE domain-containing protein n=1 Tax=Rheinheimera tangshanensis TaxID=400153 RepID=A0A5C8LWE5_9GAMM|nr:hypothetical protein [Rheinheimera tangshanensis]TXK80515.1 hypothetical protein FU839_11180 [Rheinheimera tangshanensis]GGM60691.1 hypothetical protein GCM10010920_21690 [Rheinheimera tangshanensis]
MKKIFFSILILFAIFSISRFYIFSLIKISPYPQEDAYRFIAHAGGGIECNTYTNSREAVELSISRGIRAIELDLITSEDGVLVAAHDWLFFKEIIAYPEQGSNSLSVAEINDHKIHEKYSVLFGADISNILATNPDVLLFTDKTNDFSLINDLGYNSRVYVEIFSVADYARAAIYGIKNPILNVDIGYTGVLYQMFKVFFLKPYFVALSAESAINNPRYMNWLHSRDIKIFIYTSNDPKFIAEMIQKYDAVVYVDFIETITKDLKCNF